MLSRWNSCSCLPIEIPKFVDSGITGLDFVVGSAGSRFVGMKIKPIFIVTQPNTKVMDLSLQ